MEIREGEVRYVSTRWLLEQNLKNMFSSDILIRMNTIKCYFENNNHGWELYNEMQNLRVSAIKTIPRHMLNYQNEFIKLIESMKAIGYDPNYPIMVNQNMITVDGAHRLACAMYFGIEELPITTNEKFYNLLPRPYDLEWFKNNNLNEHIDIIQQLYNEMIQRTRGRKI